MLLGNLWMWDFWGADASVLQFWKPQVPYQCASMPIALTSVKSASWSTDSIFSPGVRNKYHPETSPIKTSILRTLFSWPNHPQRSHLQNLLPWSENSNMIFWNTDIQSKEVMRWFYSCWSKSIQCLWKEVKGRVRMCGECFGGRKWVGCVCMCSSHPLTMEDQNCWPTGLALCLDAAKQSFAVIIHILFWWMMIIIRMELLPVHQNLASWRNEWASNVAKGSQWTGESWPQEWMKITCVWFTAIPQIIRLHT